MRRSMIFLRCYFCYAAALRYYALSHCHATLYFAVILFLYKMICCHMLKDIMMVFAAERAEDMLLCLYYAALCIICLLC